MTRKVCVLMGGPSVEREVSLVSGAAVAAALGEAGFDVTTVDVSRDVEAMIGAIRVAKPDVVFNALHGRFGEDGTVQGILDMMNLPYTHSGQLASALAMDKPMTKRMLAAAGVPVTDHVIASRDEVLSGSVMERPYVIKPLNEGSSVGVYIVEEKSGVPFNDGDWPFGDKVMVERFIPGRELTVAVMGKGATSRALAVTEIQTEHGFYDYGAKYDEGGSRHVLPAALSEELTGETLRLAHLAHDVLGCRGVSRADFRLDGSNLFILEVNTQPGMTPTSLVPEQAAHLGIGFGELVTWMVDHAECDG